MELIIAWLSEHMVQILAFLVVVFCCTIAESAHWDNTQANQVRFLGMQFDFNWPLWWGAFTVASICWVIVLKDCNLVGGWFNEMVGKNNFYLWLFTIIGIGLIVISIKQRHMWGAVLFFFGTWLSIAIAKLVVVTSFGLG